jgi:drug/metabolite transporter (DMT)-like permease
MTIAPSRARVATAFAAVYIIWGSTYLAIRFAVETLPPLLMAGTRFVVAGAALIAWQRLRGAPWPRAVHWREAAVVGGLMLLGGNGGVCWAEQTVPSGPTALIVGTIPLWMALLDWLWLRGAPPGAGIVLGLALGIAGVALLVGPSGLAGRAVPPLGASVVVFASVAWAAGSLYSRRAKLPNPPFLAIGMEMLAGGALLLAAATIAGEWTRLDLARVSTRSSLALAYLIVFGSFLGFSAYIWLLRATTAARASTYAFVNPVVAVFLGWALAGEPLTPRTLVAAAVTVTGVVLIIRAQTRGSSGR